ncbi:MAG: vitamin B12-dependent ribonucleotide reductase [SAR324 cluster bacterium]|nr:vitamin B12-dependent ribonucleotide reductase [SAR324 cluster bacterium]MCZ6729809.1 vitamin B12-dependent ribonucleotide reductase [SAR324 cluster bacterium]
MEDTTLGNKTGKVASLAKTGQAVRMGMAFVRHFSVEGTNPLDAVKFVRRRSEISEPNGKVVFEMDDVEVPESWTQLATDIVVSKYFRKAGVPRIERETSVEQVIYRIAHSIRVAGEESGYFNTPGDAEVFEDELTLLLVTQHGAFNSPVWFNCGLYQEYGISGSPGNWHYNAAKGQVEEIDKSFEHPQCSACFIQRVEDGLMSIFDLLKKEARVFKYGSGTGTNFSRLRSRFEPLSGGGTSSGLMSFLEVFDKGAGATKSGGTTRRAAKMVCLDMDHPEIVDFIRWKAKEEDKAKTLISGGYEADFNGEAYHTVSGQNSNNSVRITDEFMKEFEQDGEWSTTSRTTGERHETHKARTLMREIAEAAWSCADPGVQFDTTINEWHTCSNTDRIYASNPCSEFMFLDDTACNLASLNLMKFRREDGSFDLESYRHAIRVFSTAMEILVDFSSYPNADISQNSHDYRPLGLGYANLGTLLMVNGLAYDSEEGRALAAALTAILCGEAYATSAEIASHMRAFEGYERNRKPMLKVIGKHRQAARQIDPKHCPEELWHAAQQAWDNAEELGRKYGYRNSQMTVLAPTGTIGLLMDCDTTGVEPDFSIVKWKKLAGGGYIKIVNHSLNIALEKLGYNPEQVQDIIRYILGTQSLEDGATINLERLRELGYSDGEIDEAVRAVKAGGGLDEYTPHVNPAALAERGMDSEEILQAQTHIGGMETVEGAPHIRPEHLSVFDCANRCGSSGTRFIAPIAHVKMMAAVQPFISGAISKTVNMPEQTSVEEIEDIYVQSWRYGLKSVALYRDNSKGSQPLSTKLNDSGDASLAGTAVEDAVAMEQGLAWGERRVLPRRRSGFTLEATVAGHKLFLRTGEYENGELGEIFIDMYKEGAAYRSMMNSFAQAISVGLSYGVPLEKYVNMFTFTRFEPYGITDHPNVRTCTSIPDFIFRILGMEFLGRNDFIHVLPDTLDTQSDGQTPEAAPPAASATERSPASEPAHKATDALDDHMADLMGDAPVCDVCGHLTVRNGSCYRCLSCGNSMGCS